MKRPSLMDREFRSWPFVSTDPRMAEDESEHCECFAELTEAELESGKCSDCGKPLVLE